MRRRRSGPRARFDALAAWLFACCLSAACGGLDALPTPGAGPPNAPSVPPIPPPPDVVLTETPIEGAVWEVDGHPAAIVGVQVLADGHIAYLSAWAEAGRLDASGAVAAWPMYPTRGWMASSLDVGAERSMLAAATNAGIETWDAASGLPLGVLWTGWSASAVSAQGGRVAASIQPTDDDGARVAIWEPLRGGEPRSIAVSGGANALAWSPDGTRLAIATDAQLIIEDGPGEGARSWSLASDARVTMRWHPLLPLVAHVAGSVVTFVDPDAGIASQHDLGHDVRVAHWADAERIEVVIADGDVLSLEHASGATATIGSVPASTLAFDRIDDTRAAIGTRSGSVGIWDVTSGSAVRVSEPAGDRGEALALSADGDRLATGGSSGLLRTWRAADGVMLAERLMGETRIEGLAWSPDGARLAVAHAGRVDLVDATTLTVLATSPGHLSATLAFGPPGTLLTAGGAVLDADTLETLRAMPSVGIPAAWGPAGERIAVGTFEGEVRIHDASDGALLASLASGLPRVMRMAWSPDGATIAASDFSEIVAIDAVTGERRFAFAHNGPLTTLAFSADGALLMTSGWSSAAGDGVFEGVRLWDAHTGTPRGALGGGGTAGAAAFTRDARHVALTTWSGQVALVEVTLAEP